jgi:hypothetical protein
MPKPMLEEAAIKLNERWIIPNEDFFRLPCKKMSLFSFEGKKKGRERCSAAASQFRLFNNSKTRDETTNACPCKKIDM